MKFCGNSKCSTSTGICESITHGWGKLDDHGYWEHPCYKCARYYESRPDNSYGPNWPFPPRGKSNIDNLVKASSIPSSPMVDAYRKGKA